ncbi:MAG: family 16 glycoside hydrolase, partial [Planctomycetota bacterium]
ARYQRQGGQHFNPFTYRDIVTIADHLHYLGATPHGGNSKSDSAGGGHAHAGAMIYLGDQWPETYRNQLFMNNIHGQRLNVESLNPNDSGYIGSHRPDFLLTGDQASQILNLRYGPDGNAWMIDWYDMQACHRREVEQHDRSNGRIYKITYGDSETSAPSLELATASDLQLADLVLHQNDWYVRHARRVLQERAASGPIDQDAIDRLKQLLSTHRDETRRLRAAWTLHVIGELTEPDFRKMWSDAGPYVRGWGVQLAMESNEYRPTDEQLQTFTEMAGSDDSAIVRLYLASAAQLVPLPKRLPLLRALTSHAEDADDHNLPLMYWYAAEPLAGLDTMKALEFGMAAGEKIPVIREFMLRRIGSGNAEASLAVLVQGLRKVDRPALQLTYLKAIRESLKGVRRASAPKGWSSASKELLASSDDAVRLQAIALGVTFGDASALNVMRQQVSDDQSSTTDRLVALRSLLDANDAGLVSTLVSLLGDQDDLSEAAIRGLAQYDDPAVAPALLQVYGDLTPVQKRMALGTLSSRVGSGEALLTAIEAKKIPGADLTADLVRQLQFHDSKSIEALLKNVWGTVRKSAEDKLRQIEEYTTLVQSNQYAEPDLPLGRAVFAKTCMKCHKLYGEGYKIGPDLTGSNRSNLEYLLSNIVDPSSVMAKEYLPTNILTVDGRVVSGLIQEEDEQSITLQTTDALVVIPKDEIEQRIQAKQSMMPEDQLKQFSPHEIRSLIGYLRTKQQTPMLATRDNVSTLFNGNDLTGWSGTEGLWSVEAGELVGRSEGLQNNEWIVSDLSADDFRLTLEVKLVDNAGNSGIQFRSRAENGEVSGYQADIGEGWWGKLYEEHGRGLLSSPPEGQAEIRSGDWNTYEIVAVSDHVRTYINGQPCIDLKDAEGARRGIIALQLHSGGPTEVRFRNLRLELIE